MGVSCTHHESLCQWFLLLLAASEKTEMSCSFAAKAQYASLWSKASVTLCVCVCAPAASHTQATAAAVHPDIHSDPTADYRNLGLLQLLKKASRRRGGASVHSTNSAAQHSLVYAQTGQDLHSLGRAHSSLHSHAGQHAASGLFCLRWNKNPANTSPLLVHSHAGQHAAFELTRLHQNKNPAYTSPLLIGLLFCSHGPMNRNSPGEVVLHECCPCLMVLVHDTACILHLVGSSVKGETAI